MSPRPPGGTPPPIAAELNGQPIDLRIVAGVICERYHAHFIDEAERYGPVGQEWCRHDNQWLLSWAVGDLQGVTDLDEQVGWLARVLHARDFPVERLVYNLRLAGEVMVEHIGGDDGEALDAVLRRAALTVSRADGPARRAPGSAGRAA
jgi:hypothetical protein